MSKEKELRSEIREQIRAILKEDNFISRYIRNIAKRMQGREFQRLMKKDKTLKKRLAKINDKHLKAYDDAIRDVVKSYNP